jgi:hypothetical protein
MEYYNAGTFTVSFLSELLVVKENTLRTWLSRHFSDLGKKSETGRVTYSFMDAMELRVFTKLVQNFSLTPDAAKTAAMVCGFRHVELLKFFTRGDEHNPVPVYFSFRKIDQYDFAFELLESKQFVEHIHNNNNEDTLIIIPVDNLFQSTIAKINIMIEALPKSGSSDEEEKNPMTRDEIEARYKKMKRYIRY